MTCTRLAGDVYKALRGLWVYEYNYEALHHCAHGLHRNLKPNLNPILNPGYSAQ